MQTNTVQLLLQKCYHSTYLISKPYPHLAAPTTICISSHELASL